MNVGVFPICDHYYEPQFDNRVQKIDFSQDRSLHGINWNIEGQLEILKKFTFSKELLSIPEEVSSISPLKFYLNNGTFESGDAEYWYQIIRALKPNRIFEVGSGNSTLMAIKAISKNKSENQNYTCDHVCFEPYEAPWLEEVGVPPVSG